MDPFANALRGGPMSPGVPPGETDYLAKAADLLDRAAASNEGETGTITKNKRRESLARQYALLGAIQRGVLPTEMAEPLFESLNGAGAR